MAGERLIPHEKAKCLTASSSQNGLPSSHVMAVMLPISHWRCAKHTLNFVQQEVVHEA